MYLFPLVDALWLPTYHTIVRVALSYLFDMT